MNFVRLEADEMNERGSLVPKVDADADEFCANVRAELDQKLQKQLFLSCFCVLLQIIKGFLLTVKTVGRGLRD